MAVEQNWIRVAHKDDLNERGNKTVRLNGHNILIQEHEGQVYALDPRCPHMGFPLSQGSLKEGILTCHWHHARFDLKSGGCFDLFADDVRTYPVDVRGDEIWVMSESDRDEVAHQKARLQDGLEQDISLVSAKAVLSLLAHEVPASEILAIGGRFGAIYRGDGWGMGLTIMTAMGNVLDVVAPEDRPLALYHGLVHVARNTAGQMPHFELDPLPNREVSMNRLRSWFRHFIEVRDNEGAERTLLTAIAAGARDVQLADLFVAAATDHYFLDGGHTLDFVNKAFELLDMIGWKHANVILPSLVRGLAMASRSEESNPWRHPIDLVELLEPVFARLDKLVADPTRSGAWDDFEGLVDILLQDDPYAAVDSLVDALEQGAALSQLSQAVAYAAALRIARFHTSNEFPDWITVLHTFTYANAMHQLIGRAPSVEAMRGIFHSAMSIYLDRFLNMPAARMPAERAVEDLPTDADALSRYLLDLTNRQHQVEGAAAVVHRWFQQGHDPAPLIQTLAHTLLREDGEFHSYQCLEAGVQLYNELKDERPEAARNVLIAVARYLAGHAPTDRAMTQTYNIALRLHRGEALHEEVG